MYYSGVRMYIKVIHIRISWGTKELLMNVCKARGENISSFVRRAIKRELGRLSYLSQEEKKALGFGSETHDS
jgi:hypothetical protein